MKPSPQAVPDTALYMLMVLHVVVVACTPRFRYLGVCNTRFCVSDTEGNETIAAGGSGHPIEECKLFVCECMCSVVELDCNVDVTAVGVVVVVAAPSSKVSSSM